jgi:hypothetical protein
MYFLLFDYGGAFGTCPEIGLITGEAVYGGPRTLCPGAQVTASTDLKEREPTSPPPKVLAAAADAVGASLLPFAAILC